MCLATLCHRVIERAPEGAACPVCVPGCSWSVARAPRKPAAWVGLPHARANAHAPPTRQLVNCAAHCLSRCTQGWQEEQRQRRVMEDQSDVLGKVVSVRVRPTPAADRCTAVHRAIGAAGSLCS